MTRNANDHLVPLERGWSMWKWIALRGAGFPAALLARLGAPEAARAADRVLAAEDREAAAREQAIARLRGVAAGLTGRERRLINRALKRLDAGSLPELSTIPERAAPAVRSLIDSKQQLDRARDDLSRLHEAALALISDELRWIAGDDRFREAVVWQNRAVLHRAIDRVAKGSGQTTKKVRQHEQLVASYLQRYCAKNDTIGFFGPIGWGEFGRPGDSLLRAGPQLVAARKVYFEHWAIAQLAAALSANAELLPDLPPRLMPTVRLEGVWLDSSQGPAIELPELYARVLAACDGEATARVIAAALVGEGLIEEEEELYEMLSALEEKKLITWALDVPQATDAPEQELRARLERAGGVVAREGIESLDALADARHAVSCAAGDATALERALDQLESLFRQITGSRTTRRAGQTYAGRTLVYEDCLRDVEIRLGADVLSQINGALSLVLQSARWFEYTVAERCRTELDRVFDAVCADLGSEAVSCARFKAAAVDVLYAIPGAESELVDPVIHRLQTRWAEILGIEEGMRSVCVRSESIAAAVSAAFAAPHPGWPEARYHSPDLMVAARSFDDVAQGRARFVLGEIHIGINTQVRPIELRDCPHSELLLGAYSKDVDRVKLRIVGTQLQAPRLNASSLAPPSCYVEIGALRSSQPAERVVAIQELLVERMENRLIVRTRDGRLRFDIIELVEFDLQIATVSRFALAGPRAHTPRVMIDDLVIMRETWRFAPNEVGFASMARGAARFAAARRWASEHGFPPRMFAKIPEETKPLYVDFTSSLYVDLLAKLVRRASALSISEMLPDLEQTWLIDADGQQYTSELRLVAVDPIPWRPMDSMD